MKAPISAYYIKVSGLVQGVGFRPYIYRIAHENGVTGWVENNIRGVMIHAEGNTQQLEKFIADITEKAPPAAQIDRISKSTVDYGNFTGFTIRKSSDDVSGITEISPDIAVCDDCLADMNAQPHRIAYPFTNCTNCGPRFTIIRDLPYDRDKTTMDVFEMCGTCRAEYTDVLDRRFHAQPGDGRCQHHEDRFRPCLSLRRSRAFVQGLSKSSEVLSVPVRGASIRCKLSIGSHQIGRYILNHFKRLAFSHA